MSYSFFKGEFSLPHVVHERVEVVSLCDSDLERVASGDVARQPCQALLPRPSYANKQHIPTRHTQDAGHRNEVPEGIIKKNQIHLRSGEIIG